MMDACAAGVCTGPATPCDDMNPCTADSCDTGMDACVNDPTPLDGMGCDDGRELHSHGTCAQAAPAWASTRAPTTATRARSTRAIVPADMCVGGADETMCAGGEICNPTAYPAGMTGCGAAPDALTLGCPATTAGSPSACGVSLTAGGMGVPGEAGNLACVADPGPTILFADNFDSGSLDPHLVCHCGRAGRRNGRRIQRSTGGDDIKLGRRSSP